MRNSTESRRDGISHCDAIFFGFSILLFEFSSAEYWWNVQHSIKFQFQRHTKSWIMLISSTQCGDYSIWIFVKVNFVASAGSRIFVVLLKDAAVTWSLQCCRRPVVKPSRLGHYVWNAAIYTYHFVRLKLCKQINANRTKRKTFYISSLLSMSKLSPVINQSRMHVSLICWNAWSARCAQQHIQQTQPRGSIDRSIDRWVQHSQTDSQNRRINAMSSTAFMQITTWPIAFFGVRKIRANGCWLCWFLPCTMYCSYTVYYTTLWIDRRSRGSRVWWFLRCTRKCIYMRSSVFPLFFSSFTARDAVHSVVCSYLNHVFAVAGAAAMPATTRWPIW